MKVHLRQEEFVRVIIFIETRRGSHHSMDVLKSATITNADFFHIWFGMRGVAAFRISWDFFLEQNREPALQ